MFTYSISSWKSIKNNSKLLPNQSHTHSTEAGGSPQVTTTNVVVVLRLWATRQQKMDSLSYSRSCLFGRVITEIPFGNKGI